MSIELQNLVQNKLVIVTLHNFTLGYQVLEILRVIKKIHNLPMRSMFYLKYMLLLV